MKKSILFTLILLFFLFPFYGFGDNNKNIKLAIFDNPEIDTNDITASERLENSYMQGIEVAQTVAKEKGININYKTFFYGSSLLNIIQEAPNVKTWDPDVIMGLNSSNACLASRTFFDNVLVLSIAASDPELAELPSNFYSLGTPDPLAAPVLVKFINKYYPNRNLFFIIGADSKESMDFESLVASQYKAQHPNNTIVLRKFLSDEVDSIDLPSLLEGYKHGDIILLFSLAGSYGIQIKLMNEISNYLSPNKVVFINDIDNWNNRNLPNGYNNTDNPYTAYRLDTLFADTNSNNYKVYEKNFQKLYHTNPTDTISFITYQTVMSFVLALEKYPAPKNLNTKQAILWSYQQAIKWDPNWFRPIPYVIYKFDQNKEVYFTSFK